MKRVTLLGAVMLAVLATLPNIIVGEPTHRPSKLLDPWPRPSPKLCRQLSKPLKEMPLEFWYRFRCSNPLPSRTGRMLRSTSSRHRQWNLRKQALHRASPLLRPRPLNDVQVGRKSTSSGTHPEWPQGRGLPWFPLPLLKIPKSDGSSCIGNCL